MFVRLARIAPLLLVAGGLSLVAVGSAAADLSPAQQTAMLAAQNAVRRNVAAAETQRLGMTVTIPDLTWNAEAAAVAQSWANNLLASNTFAHNPNLNGYGENIYMESGYGPVDDGQRAVQDWAAEGSAYNWDTNSCSSVCGHYTQLVWAATTSVGCGVASNGRDTYWVCDYAPPGNFAGQRPYEPGGPAASAAPGAPANPPANAAPPFTPPAGAAPPTGLVSLTGTWTVDDFGRGAGGTLSLVQVGDQVAGMYSYADPSGCGDQNGVLVGTFDGTSFDFTTTESGCAGDGEGGGSVIVAPDGTSMYGAFNATRAEM